jgi:cytochrome c oxidase subunit III
MATETAITTETRKIHPHKFALWLGMGSISMMFAGLTSAYMVREAQGNWRYYYLPNVFWYSTAAIFISSIILYLAVQAFKKRNMGAYRIYITVTAVLGVAFGVLQFAGFNMLFTQLQQIRINGQVLRETAAVKLNGNPSESFLYIIAGLHLAHLAGGLLALLFVFFKSFSKKIKIYSTTGLELVASYWHFMDALWIYLFIFFLRNQ